MFKETKEDLEKYGEYDYWDSEEDLDEEELELRQESYKELEDFA